MTWTVSFADQSVSDTVRFSLLTSTLTVTNMAPLTILPTADPESDSATVVHLQAILSQIALPTGFDGVTAAIVSIADVRGGNAYYQQGDGSWVYSPHDTTYNTFAPWDPYHPYGGGPNDGVFGGAAFFVTVTDENGMTIKVNVTFGQDHIGYTFLHKENGAEGSQWVESTPHGGKGGLLLAGGGNENVMTDTGTTSGYSVFHWFVDQSFGAAFGESYQGGDIVVIANKHDENGVALQYNEFLQYGARSVDVFNFDATDSGLTALAMAIAQDICGIDGIDVNGLKNDGLGNELIDKLLSAEAVYFMGGDQWPYVQLLTPKQDSNN